jgi:D-aminopeptidase
VVVKRGLGYSLADSLSPAQAATAIGDGMRAALGRLDDMDVYRPASPITGEIDFRFPAHAAFAAVLPEARRIGPRTVAFDASDGDTFYRRFLAVQRLAASAGL